MIPFTISDLSLSFFAKGRPWVLSIQNPNFSTVRQILARGVEPSEIDTLIGLADIRAQLRTAGLVVDGDAVLWNGTPLHNVWVDKILLFQSQGLPFDPIFNALNDLMANPTPEAIERLPIFVERSGLGFMPDGRIAAYKGVRDNYRDVHTGSVSYKIGTHVWMPRECCNPDPRQTCVSGLHVGALDYIRNEGYGWGHDRRLLMTAFWPRDVVAVPVDYAGGKMRVCALDVLEEVDRDFVDQHMGFNRSLVGYSPPPPSSPFPLPQSAAQRASVGDWVRIGEGSVVRPGTYRVGWISETPDTRLGIEITPHTDMGILVNDDAVTGVFETAASAARVNETVRISGDPDVPDGLYQVVHIDEFDMDGCRVQIEWDGSHLFVPNDCVKEIHRWT